MPASFDDFQIGQVHSLGVAAVDAKALDAFIAAFSPGWEASRGAPDAMVYAIWSRLEIEAGDRFANAVRADVGRHFRDDGRCELRFVERLGFGFNDGVASGFEHAVVRIRTLAALAVLDAAFMALQAMVEPFDRTVERGVGVACFVVALQRHPAAHMHRNISAEDVALAFEHDLAFERAAKIAIDRRLKNFADMVAQ